LDGTDRNEPKGGTGRNTPVAASVAQEQYRQNVCVRVGRTLHLSPLLIYLIGDVRTFDSRGASWGRQWRYTSPRRSVDHAMEKLIYLGNDEEKEIRIYAYKKRD